MADPQISVIMPVRNGEPYFAAALASVLDQQRADFELVVVDDGSTDGTAALLAACPDPRLRVLQGGGLGVGGALALAQAAARGEFVARMDADDIALPGRLALQAQLLRDNPAVAMVYCSARVIDGEGREVGHLPAQPFNQQQRREVLLEERQGRPIIHPGVMIRRSMLEAAGGYRPLPASQDHELWLRLIEQGPFLAMPEELLLYRRHGQSVTSSKQLQQLLIHMVSCVAARYRRQTGIDLYVDAPERYRELEQLAAREAGPWLERCIKAWQLRALIAARKPLPIVRELLALLPDGAILLIFNRFASAQNRRLQHRLLAHLAARGDLTQ